MPGKRKKGGPVDLGAGAAITRRDFIGATLLGAGAGLLAMKAPLAAAVEGNASRAAWPPRSFGPEWTGPGGLGDYRFSNGNTHEVVNAAHKLAGGAYVPLPADATDTGEIYDLVMVGGGFAGMSAAVTAMWEGKKCLVLDNHPIFGGEGKMNVMDVDGTTLYAPQGSNDFGLPNKAAQDMDFVDPYWQKLGLPMEFSFAKPPERMRGKIKIARDNFGPQIHQQAHASQAHFYFNRTGDGGTWAMHPWENGFKEAPIDAAEKDEIMRFVKDMRLPERAKEKGWEAWLDSMSYKDYIEKVMGYSPRMTEYMDMVVAAGYTGCACEHVSAYGAHTFAYPVTLALYGEAGLDLLNGLEFGTFPGGNAGIIRYFVKNMIPDAIAGEKEYSDIHNGALNFEALDRPSNAVRIRLGALAVHVKHDGDRAKAGTVTVAYEKGGKLYLVKGRSVVMCGQGYINKRILADIPTELTEAYRHFAYGPMLTINVALRNWRFLEKMGVSAVRWFGGDMGFWVNVRQPMVMSDGTTAPLDPDLPVILSNYIAFPTAGVDVNTSGTLGRTKLFSMPYSELEAWVVKHYSLLFSSYGFDAKRDIAGIITNRWGHAYVSPGANFFFDQGGKISPMNRVQAGYGRIFFGHSETAGRQLWSVAAAEGRRAAKQALALL